MEEHLESVRLSLTHIADAEASHGEGEPPSLGGEYGGLGSFTMANAPPRGDRSGPEPAVLVARRKARLQGATCLMARQLRGTCSVALERFARFFER